MSFSGFSPRPEQPWGRSPGRAGPSLWWVVPGVAAIVAGIVGAAVFGLSAVFQMPEKVGQFQRIQAPGAGDVSLVADHDYTIYFEYGGASEEGPGKDVAVTVTDPGGGVVRLSAFSTTTTYWINDFEGRAGYSFHTNQGGTYRLAAEYSSGVTVAVGEGAASGAWKTVGIAIAIAVVGCLVGAVIIVTVVIRRARNRASFGSLWDL
ncbi:hypothetical protein LTV02_08535 [Nocardia yamanashiensis]|uniref:hypothetical protein n=1 Tax=Nocardia yamanashiensis TaxID=209247 RepID=UPI001E64954E|nr:hypothetical protein [Nocardia yamanashiensis]UGT43417.1 hypothetical protein LTV02_08535 [Nocardia yamanashiensis]